MTGASFSFDYTQAQEAFGRLRLLAANPTILLNCVGVGLARNVADRFDAGAGPGGAPWAGLSPAYAAVKVGPGILVVRGRSGGLQGSITAQVEGAAVLVGSNKIYAAVHQFGATIRPVNAAALVFRLGERVVRVKSVTIPARPYLGFDAADEVMVVRVAQGYLEAALADGPDPFPNGP